MGANFFACVILGVMSAMSGSGNSRSSYTIPNYFGLCVAAAGAVLTLFLDGNFARATADRVLYITETGFVTGKLDDESDESEGLMAKEVPSDSPAAVSATPVSNGNYHAE